MACVSLRRRQLSKRRLAGLNLLIRNPSAATSANIQRKGEEDYRQSVCLDIWRDGEASSFLRSPVVEVLSLER